MPPFNSFHAFPLVPERSDCAEYGGYCTPFLFSMTTPHLLPVNSDGQGIKSLVKHTILFYFLPFEC